MVRDDRRPGCVPPRARPLARGAGWLAAYILASLSAVGLAGAGLCTTAHAAESVTPTRATSVDALARRLSTWVADPDPQTRIRSHHAAIARVQEGVPPGAMVAFLVAVRSHPDTAFEATVREATGYRKLEVRGHALATLAELGPAQALDAIRRAADDPERGVRRLAIVLAEQHPSIAAEEVVARMLTADPDLAAERSESTALVPEGPPPPDDEADPPEDDGDDEDVIVIEEDSP